MNYIKNNLKSTEIKLISKLCSKSFPKITIFNNFKLKIAKYQKHTPADFVSFGSISQKYY